MKIAYRQHCYYQNVVTNHYRDIEPLAQRRRPEVVVIKPTLRCPAKCTHCSGRLKSFSDPREMTLNHYSLVFQELKLLGTRTIHVSGGEPLLYPGIYELVSLAAKAGFAVTLNTNGWLLPKTDMMKLFSLGLVGLNVSIDSPESAVHDRLRGIDGLFNRVTHTLPKIKSSGIPFILNLRMILSKYNYRHIEPMIDLAVQMKCDALSIDMIENDSINKLFLLSAGQIMEFRSSIVPSVIRKLKAVAFQNEALRNLAIEQVSTIFPTDINPIRNFEEGIYWPDERVKRSCTIPSTFMIIEGDGCVLPCNAVEYTRHPIIGNLHTNTISELWNSSAWMEFGRDKMDSCVRCPMNQSYTLMFSDVLIEREI